MWIDWAALFIDISLFALLPRGKIKIALNNSVIKSGLRPLGFEAIYLMGPVGFEPTTASAPGQHLDEI